MANDYLMTQTDIAGDIKMSLLANFYVVLKHLRSLKKIVLESTSHNVFLGNPIFFLQDWYNFTK